MPAPEHLVTFLIATVVLVLVPGPTVVFVVSQAIVHGRRAALASVAGNSLGVYLLVVAVAFGIGAVVDTSVALFTAIKLVGAAYLIFLGIRAFRDRHLLAGRPGVAPISGGRRQFWRGFVVGITNPKAIVFFAAVLPQFVDRAAANPAGQMLVLGLIFVAVAMVLDSMWGLAAGTARQWLARSPRRTAVLGGTGGVMMIGLGAGLAISGSAD
ncbi:MAG: LysE family translocator [Pseudonocardiales bacterium]|nr:LysE family translocator [Pseudonocardiales bacterium]